jgi:hypothetical protein
MAAVFALIGGSLYWHGNERYLIWLTIAAFFLAVSLAMPRLLLPLKRLWLKLGTALHTIANPIILAFLYVFSIVLVGFLVRIARKDLLSLKLNSAATSYWIKRAPAQPSPESLRNQF